MQSSTISFTAQLSGEYSTEDVEKALLSLSNALITITENQSEYKFRPLTAFSLSSEGELMMNVRFIE